MPNRVYPTRPALAAKIVMILETSSPSAPAMQDPVGRDAAGRSSSIPAEVGRIYRASPTWIKLKQILVTTASTTISAATKLKTSPRPIFLNENDLPLLKDGGGTGAGRRSNP
jgi:hypothetical protein